MKTCLRLALDNGEPGRLLDLSLVADDHEFGPSPDGAEIHIEGRGEFTVTRGTPYQDAAPEPPAVNGIPFTEAAITEDGYVERRVPPGADFRTVTEDDTPSAFYAAAAEGLRRDALWRNPPPLAGDCDHDMRVLPVTEFRQTVLCAKCGGLDVTLSQAIAAAPSAFTVHDDGHISRSVMLKRRDPAEARARLRAMAMSEDIIEEILKR